MRPPKNHLRLIDIFGEVLRRQPTAVLLLVGQGRNAIERRLHRRIAQLGLGGQVVFCQERTDVPRLLGAADALIFPSLWEGLPGVVLEACAAGTPVLASDLPGVRDIAARLPRVRCLSLEADNSAMGKGPAGYDRGGQQPVHPRSHPAGIHPEHLHDRPLRRTTLPDLAKFANRGREHACGVNRAAGAAPCKDYPEHKRTDSSWRPAAHQFALRSPTPSWRGRGRRHVGCHCWLVQQCREHGWTSQVGKRRCPAAADRVSRTWAHGTRRGRDAHPGDLSPPGPPPVPIPFLRALRPDCRIGRRDSQPRRRGAPHAARGGGLFGPLPPVAAPAPSATWSTRTSITTPATRCGWRLNAGCRSAWPTSAAPRRTSSPRRPAGWPG